MSETQHLDEKQIKHLEMIQAVIARMAGNSFALKGWAVTVAGAVLAFGADRKDTAVALLALVPAIVFWGLDGYYLALERRFRALYDDVRTGKAPAEEGAFSMNIAPYLASETVARAVFRPTVWPIYAALIVVAGIVAVAPLLRSWG